MDCVPSETLGVTPGCEEGVQDEVSRKVDFASLRRVGAVQTRKRSLRAKSVVTFFGRPCSVRTQTPDRDGRSVR